MSRLRVAYVSADPGVPAFGRKGASVHVREFLRALRRHGAEVDLFTPPPSAPPPPDLADVRIHELPMRPRGRSSDHQAYVRAANAALAGALAQAGALDVVYERYSLWSEAGMHYARRRAIASLLEVNAPLIDEQERYRGPVGRPAAERAAARIFADAQAIVAVSREVAAWVGRWPAARGRVHVVANGVDPSRFAPRAPRSRDGPFVVGFLGTLKPWHGLSTLVGAVAKLAAGGDVRLLVVGDGPERPALERALAHRGLTPIATLTGSVDPDEVPAWLAQMDVGVAPYPSLADFYFSPLKVFEYLAAGLPVVASRVGQVARMLRGGEAGILVPPEDEEALAAALERLRRAPALRDALGDAGRRIVERDHTWDGVVDRVLRLALPDRAWSPA